jgi:hypothetical protein
MATKKLNKQQKQAKTLDFGSLLRKAQSGDALAKKQLEDMTAGDIDYNKDFGKLNPKDLQWLYNNVPNLKDITDQAFEDYAIRNHITKDEAMNVDIADAMKASSAENRAQQADIASKNDDKWNPVNVPGSGNKKQIAQGNLTEDRPLTKAEERRVYDKSITDEESKDVDALQNATREVKSGSTETKPASNVGDVTTSITTEGTKTETPVVNAEQTENEGQNFNVGNKVEDAPEDNKDLKKFWDSFRAGSLRAYPWLQTIGDAIGKNARMTQDRAAILTGGQRDAEAYNPVNPEDHMTDELRVEQAYADARAGNLDSVKKLIMNGDVTIENVAAALNMSEEDAKKVFGNYMVKDTAEARTSEANADQAEAQVMSTYLQNETTVQNNINFIDEKIREIDTAINQLQSNDYDTYLKVYGEYVNNVRGIENTGIASTATSNEGFGADVDVNARFGVLKAGASGNFDKSWGSSNTSTGSTDVLAKQALPKAEYMAQSAMGERNAANDELIQKLEAQKAQLVAARDTWQQTLNDAMAQRKGNTKLNYKPNTQGAE